MNMSTAGPCEICLTGTVEYTCDRCGNLVCERHIDETTGFCSECATSMGGDPNSKGKPPADTDTDTHVYRF